MAAVVAFEIALVQWDRTHQSVSTVHSGPKRVDVLSERLRLERDGLRQLARQVTAHPGAPSVAHAEGVGRFRYIAAQSELHFTCGGDRLTLARVTPAMLDTVARDRGVVLDLLSQGARLRSP